MSVNELKFSRDWTKPTDFPTHQPDEATVRADIQSLHNETRDYINREIVPRLNDVSDVSSVGMFYGESGDGITYNITDENAPIVTPGSGGAWVGKGKQMLFVPRTNSGKSLQISINGKEAIPVKCRRAGGLAETLTNGISAGVPYLMTFCGLYWLIDSWIYEESGVDFKTDETLKLENGVLSVNIAGDAEQDNTLPISSAAVYTEIGNIDAILKTI